MGSAQAQVITKTHIQIIIIITTTIVNIITIIKIIILIIFRDGSFESEPNGVGSSSSPGGGWSHEEQHR